MGTLDFSDHSTKKQNEDYFIHLIRIAKADNTISNTELKLLNHLGKELGYLESEIADLIETTKMSDYIPPYELSERFGQVYNVVRMTLADGSIDKNEMRLASSFALQSGFSDSEIPRLLVLLLSGIREGKSAEDLFKVFKKQKEIYTAEILSEIS
jgi:hypothetical protein